MEHNVHRAARVFTPRNVVIVNAADAELRRRLEEAGGAQRALDWVLGGLCTPDFTQLGPSRSSFIESMLAQNIPRETAEQMADAGGLEDEETPALSLPAPALRVAERQAAFVATGLYGSRVPVNEMLEGKDPDMRFRYERSLRRAGFESVDLVDRFPVLTGCYGFTRGDMGPGQSTIVPFMAPGTNEYAIYSERSETEALFVRLDPVMIVSWLASRGIDLPEPADARDARRIVLENATWPAAGSDPSGDGSVGELVTILVHSFAHRLLRRTAVIAGIERESLSEFLVPAHLGFFVYDRFNRTANDAGLLNEASPVLFQLATAFVGMEAGVAFNDFVQNYDRQVTVEDVLEGKAPEMTEGFSDIDHVALVEKLENSDKLKEKLSDDEAHNLFTYMVKLPSEAFMKLWTAVGKLNQDNAITLHGQSLSDGTNFKGLLVEMLTGKKVQ